jgi:muramoyltetrapeptide carboxypeptidase
MMGVNLDRESADLDVSKATLKKALFGKDLKYKFPKNTNNKGTEAKGELIGGNLTLLQHLLGSESLPNTKDKLVFIEEIGEYKYHIDRLMQSLKRAGFFEHSKGLVIGDFTNIKSNNPQWGSSIESLILDVVKNYDFPVFFGFDAGHEIKNQALILGANISVETLEDSVELKINH